MKFGAMGASVRTLWGAKIFYDNISHTICRSATKFGSLRGLTSGHLFPEFG